MDPEQTLEEARARILACEDAAALKDLEREYIGKKGAVAAMLAAIPTLAPEDRKAHGQKANALKQSIVEAVAERQKHFDGAKLEAARRADDFDPTLPPPRAERGSLHPITQVTRELEDLFISMGYEVLDGPEVELDHYNFEALNITKDHPARDSQDTFYCDREGHLVGHDDRAVRPDQFAVGVDQGTAGVSGEDWHVSHDGVVVILGHHADRQLALEIAHLAGGEGWF